MAAAAIAGAAIALPLGIALGRHGAPDPPAAGPVEPPLQAGTRNRWDPALSNDPHVLAEQLRVVESMERGCALSGEGCIEAAAARRLIDERINAARGR